MFAIVKQHTSTALIQTPIPKPPAGWVRVKISHVGVCRTDVYIAQGKIPVKPPRILGHECSGIVDATGAGVPTHWHQKPVAINPIISCGTCPSCLARDHLVCHHPRMIGMDLDGAFAQYVIVPQRNIFSVEEMSLKLAAYLEPIAASMAILQAPITPQMKGLIFGDNRIARLTHTILEHHGFEHVHIHDAETPSTDLPDHHYDFCVETLATTHTMNTLMRVIKSRGTLILKSRPAAPVGIDFRAALQKELTLRATQYAPFEHAINFAHQHPNAVDHLLGACHPLTDYEHVFANGGLNGQKKAFLLPWSQT